VEALVASLFTGPAEGGSSWKGGSDRGRKRIDHWVVLGKRKWGFELQAFYIDALLSGHYLRASPSYLPVLLFAAFVLALEGVPALRKSSNHILWKRGHVLWNLILFSTLFVLTSVIFYLMHYLPPLLMLFSALMAVVARLIFSEYENAEHGIASKNEKMMI